MVRNELVLRLFLLSTLEHDEARRFLDWIAESHGTQRDTLRAEIATADSTADHPAGRGLTRLFEEFGLRSLEVLAEWARWALDHIDSADAPRLPPEASGAAVGRVRSTGRRGLP